MVWLLYGLRGSEFIVCAMVHKSPSIRAYQEDPVLSGKVEEIKRIAELINERIKEKDLKLNEDGIISGELIINDYEEN